ncbi:sugar ABC transporter ATP-binding protein [Lacunimicrobium album]
MTTTFSQPEPAAERVTSVPILDCRHLCKTFPGVQALDDVSFHLGKGEVLAVIGENGAGKSTLMKILAGVQTPDQGEIHLDGKVVHLDSVLAAQKHGIALIHQELNLLDNLDVASNLFLGREKTRFGMLDQAAMNADAVSYLQRVGLQISPSDRVSKFSIGQQQLIEIAKALSINARILIMDEPSSSLPAAETNRLFEIVRQLKSEGVSIIYISHRLGEVKELADRVFVMRDGKPAGTLQRDEISHERMVSLMVGRNIKQFYSRTPPKEGSAVLKVTDLVTTAYPEKKVSLKIRQGEVVGIAGLIGAGRTELLRVLAGVDQPLRGTIEVDGKPAQFRHPRDAIRAGLMLVPEDRKDQGLMIEDSVADNMTLPSLGNLAIGGILQNRSEQRKITVEGISSLRIKTHTSKKIVKFLSGGNQQKIVIAKWLGMSPRLLLLDEPTRGIDIGAKEEIYSLMDQLADEGMAILFVSSDLEEVINMADRALVMHEGQIAGELGRDQLTEQAIMSLATGQLNNSALA